MSSAPTRPTDCSPASSVPQSSVQPRGPEPGRLPGHLPNSQPRPPLQSGRNPTIGLKVGNNSLKKRTNLSSVLFHAGPAHTGCARGTWVQVNKITGSIFTQWTGQSSLSDLSGLCSISLKRCPVTGRYLSLVHPWCTDAQMSGRWALRHPPLHLCPQGRPAREQRDRSLLGTG